ncbi:Cysteine-rich small domain-containing protein [Eubacterium ruminantium]|nr:Cysteine-rich small domain-containing protein [Eubacterium ruminantium]
MNVKKSINNIINDASESAGTGMDADKDNGRYENGTNNGRACDDRVNNDVKNSSGEIEILEGSVYAPSHKYFENRACPYYPCHKVDSDTKKAYMNKASEVTGISGETADAGEYVKNADVHINCLFCFCPMYHLENCPGNPAYKEKNGRRIKVCTNCTFPHEKDNYDRIMEILRL